MHVFIVEDSAPVRERLDELLRGVENVEISGQAATVAGALAEIPRTHPDFVILDVRLPDGDGIALLRQLKGLDHPPAVGMLTNYPFEPYRRRCLALGADFFWDKSKDFAAIPTALRQLAGERGRVRKERGRP